MPTIYLPTPMRQFNSNKARIEIAATTIPALLSALDSRCPGIHERLYDENGKVKRYINIFLNNEDIRYLDAESVQLADRDEISIIPAMAGG